MSYLEGTACRCSKKLFTDNLSPTSTLSSGYESGCVESDFDENVRNETQNQDSSEYFVLESDSYVRLDEKETDFKLKQVKNSMLKIINDLESIGWETSFEDLTRAVEQSVKPTNNNNSEKRNRRRRKIKILDESEDEYKTSPVDELFKEIDLNMNRKNEVLYSRLISNLAQDGTTPVHDEPIYEEIHEDSEFDMVLHSDTYRRHSLSVSTRPPALPPRPSNTECARRSTCPELSQKPAHSRQISVHSLTEVDKVKRKKDRQPFISKSASWHRGYSSNMELTYV